MKPRRNSATLTDEDTDIWFDLRGFRGKREFECAPLIRKRLEGDRRDAELMYLAQLWRRGEIVTDHTYAHNGPCGRFAIDAKRCGGDI